MPTNHRNNYTISQIFLINNFNGVCVQKTASTEAMFWTAIALALTFLTPYKSFFKRFILVLAESHPFAMNDNLISVLIFHDKPTCGNLIGVNRQMAEK